MKKVLILYKDEVPAAVPAATATASAVVSSPLQGKAIDLSEVKDGETVKKVSF